MINSDLLDKIERLETTLVERATGEGGSNSEYKNLRQDLLQDKTARALLPQFVVNCRDLADFWTWIKAESSNYQGRRLFIRTAFTPLVSEIENASTSPIDSTVATMLERLDSNQVHQAWERALDRRDEDPDGAITAARTLLESVCKTILDEMGIAYSDNFDLPKLYSLTAERLNLAPSQHTERILKQILGGCQAVVEGLGALRNKLGDAHGQGKQPIRPSSRHAELAVNLAGAMATFLVTTWEHQKRKTKQTQA